MNPVRITSLQPPECLNICPPGDEALFCYDRRTTLWRITELGQIKHLSLKL